MITEANVTVMVSDISRNIQFYVDTLGLKLKSRYADQFAEVECPGLTIALHPAVNRGPKPGSSESPSVGFGVADIESAMTELKGRSVSFSRVSNDGRVNLAFFKDPDGNPLYLAQTQKWK
jgi:catechol 2,3-dioxygenase-like lactoylglutathione lyase family enzyme